METTMLDTKTLMIQSDNMTDLLNIVDSVNQKKKEHMKNFFAFAAQNRKPIKEYKFNRQECYE